LVTSGTDSAYRNLENHDIKPNVWTTLVDQSLLFHSSPYAASFTS
jgi:hypothetical protein